MSLYEVVDFFKYKKLLAACRLSFEYRFVSLAARKAIQDECFAGPKSDHA